MLEIMVDKKMISMSDKWFMILETSNSKDFV